VAGLQLTKADDPRIVSAKRARKAVEEALEAMAEMEHEGWMEHKFRNDWTYHKDRDDKLKRHDCLVPFSVLPEDQKEKDRTQVQRYLDFAAGAGYGIMFIEQN
jgi:hypothetical protein